jgi:FMN-dependent NADH-azoreductase
MIEAYFTPSQQRSPRQRRLLAESDGLIEEVKGADVLVLGIPIYNLSVPAVVKAYIDLICRVGETFRYTKTGPEGLLRDRKTYVVISSGSTTIESESDFVSGYIRRVMGFMGIQDVEIIKAHRLNFGDEGNQEAAKEQIHQSLEALRGEVVV